MTVVEGSVTNVEGSLTVVEGSMTVVEGSMTVAGCMSSLSVTAQYQTYGRASATRVRTAAAIIMKSERKQYS